MNQQPSEVKELTNNALTIIEINSAQVWQDYVIAHPKGTCFHNYGWKKTLAEALGYTVQYLGAFEGEKCVGVFPLAIVKSRLFGNSAVSLPFCTYGGPLTTHDEALIALSDAAKKIALEHNVSYLEHRERGTEQVIAELEGTYFSFRKGIPPGPAEMTFMPSKRRNMVRKASAAGLTYEVNLDVNTFFELYSANAKAHGTPALPIRFFKSLINSLGENVDILFVKNKEGIAISCIMSFYHNGSVHAGFAGELPEARQFAANDFKYWSLLQHAVSRNCVEFDLGRSKIGTGSFEFKKLWGLNCFPVVHHRILISGKQLPNNNPNNPKFSLAIKIWPKLPSRFTNWLGPKIIHGLG